MRGPGSFIRAFLASCSIGALSAMPSLGQQRGFSLARGSGVVTSAPGMKRKPKRDSESQMRAVLKRRRKNAKRLRDWQRCVWSNPCLGIGLRGHLAYAKGANDGC